MKEVFFCPLSKNKGFYATFSTLQEQENAILLLPRWGGCGVVEKTLWHFQSMFTFRLEPLITIRNNELKERRSELAKAYEARKILEEHIQEIDRQLTEGIAVVRSLMQEGQTINVESLLSFRRQEMFLRAQQSDLMEKMEATDQEIERRRALVVAANKELKIIEKLKEKRYEKYLEEENKTEMKNMDEIAGNRRTQHQAFANPSSTVGSF